MPKQADDWRDAGCPKGEPKHDKEYEHGESNQKEVDVEE